VQKGWAVDNEEHEEGIRCIAAPVKDFTRNVIAALSISGDKNILKPERDEMFANMVVSAAAEISKRMGFYG
jgi:IclR family KDG regulon transcriptional repressor